MKNQILKKSFTFSHEGLNDAQINFLNEVEKLFFAGVQISFNTMMLPAFNACGYAKGSKESIDCLEAWKYWEFLKRPVYRESYKKPIKLSKLVKLGGKTTLMNDNYKSLKIDYIGKDLDMLDLTVYFTIKNNCLWCNYNTILGSRFVACIINDLTF